MLRDAAAGVGLAARRWPLVVGLASLTVIACAMVTLTLIDVLGQTSVLRARSVLAEHAAVAFTVSYGSSQSALVTGELVSDLATAISNKTAYTAVLFNAALDDPRWEGNQPLVLIGDAVPELFPELQLCSPAPCAMYGVSASRFKGQPLRLGDVDMTVDTPVVGGATYADPIAGPQLLDRRVVVRLPPTALKSLGAEALQEAITRTTLISPDPSTIDSFVAAAARSSLLLVPQSFTGELTESYRDSLTTAAINVAGAVALLCLILAAILSTATDTARREARALKIRELCGATSVQLAFRWGTFLAIVFMIPSLMVVGLVSLAFGSSPEGRGLGWLALAVVVLFVVLWTVTARVAGRGRLLGSER